jgi:hypothetical protein
VTGVQGHNRTMKFEWPKALTAFWERLVLKIRTHGTRILAGDFNMALTEVVKQLSIRGIPSDCIAWYPWRSPTLGQDQPLGIDSCGIFCLGGSVQVSMPWCWKDIDILTAVAGDIERECLESGKELDLHTGANTPGQHWSAYRSRALLETKADKNLGDRLRDLLKPSTPSEELQDIPRRPGSYYCPYLRWSQKKMDMSEWLVDGKMHNGAHFPLCVFTKNASARSNDKAIERAIKKEANVRAGKGRSGQSSAKGASKGAEKGSVPAVAADNEWGSYASNPREGAHWQAGWSGDAWSDYHSARSSTSWNVRL